MFRHESLVRMCTGLRAVAARRQLVSLWLGSQRNSAAMEEKLTPPLVSSLLAARRSAQWHNIDALLTTLREVRSESNKAA